MACLAGADRVDFTALKRLVNATDGNLGTHLQKLEVAGYINAEKQFRERKPVTTYSLTQRGRAAFQAYLNQLAAMLPGAEPSYSGADGAGESEAVPKGI
ncbi:MAG: hypothetical protein RLZZ290_1558 [Pseudomonadota bacterium]|jgi:DNA-binding PadR family transcriptional regulator